jgi:hypothetical protein
MITKGLIDELNKNGVIWQRVNKDVAIIPNAIDYETMGVIHSCKYCHSHYMVFRDGETGKPPRNCPMCGRRFEQWENLLIDIEERGKPYPKGDKHNGVNFITYWEDIYKSNTCCFCSDDFGFYPYVNMGTEVKHTWIYLEGVLPRYCPVCGEKYKGSEWSKNFFKSYLKAPDFEKWKYQKMINPNSRKPKRAINFWNLKNKQAR